MQLRRGCDEGCVGCCEQQNCAEARRHSATRHAEGLGPEVLALVPPSQHGSAPASRLRAGRPRRGVDRGTSGVRQTEERSPQFWPSRRPGKDLKKLSGASRCCCRRLNPPPLPTAQAPRRAMAAAEGPAAAAVAAADASSGFNPGVVTPRRPAALKPFPKPTAAPRRRGRPPRAAARRGAAELVDAETWPSRVARAAAGAAAADAGREKPFASPAAAAARARRARAAARAKPFLSAPPAPPGRSRSPAGAGRRRRRGRAHRSRRRRAAAGTSLGRTPGTAAAHRRQCSRGGRAPVFNRGGGAAARGGPPPPAARRRRTTRRWCGRERRRGAERRPAAVPTNSASPAPGRARWRRPAAARRRRRPPQHQRARPLFLRPPLAPRLGDGRPARDGPPSDGRAPAVAGSARRRLAAPRSGTPLSYSHALITPRIVSCAAP